MCGPTDLAALAVSMERILVLATVSAGSLLVWKIRNLNAGRWTQKVFQYTTGSTFLR